MISSEWLLSLDRGICTLVPPDLHGDCLVHTFNGTSSLIDAMVNLWIRMAVNVTALSPNCKRFVGVYQEVHGKVERWADGARPMSHCHAHCHLDVPHREVPIEIGFALESGIK